MPHTILYIEDNPDNRLLVKRALEARGYLFVGAANGLEGLDLATNQQPDIILLDINLPDIDGYEVARRIRALNTPYTAYVPIIAVTANALKGDAEKALAAGCNVYMSKPINIRELWARVEAFLPGARIKVCPIYPTSNVQTATVLFNAEQVQTFCPDCQAPFLARYDLTAARESWTETSSATACQGCGGGTNSCRCINRKTCSPWGRGIHPCYTCPAWEDCWG